MAGSMSLSLTHSREQLHHQGANMFTRSGAGTLAVAQTPSWTQTGVRIGMTPLSQIQSIAGTLTRTQPCDAG